MCLAKNNNQLSQLRLSVLVQYITQNVANALRQCNNSQQQNENAFEFISEKVQASIRLLLLLSLSVQKINFRPYNRVERHVSLVQYKHRQMMMMLTREREE